MKNKNVNLGEGSVGKLLINLAVPAIIAQMVNLLYNIVDRIFIGRMANGEIAMAGIGVAMPIIMIISAFSYLIGSGGAPLTAIKMGEKNNDEAEKIMSNSFSMLLIIGVSLTIVFLLFKEPILWAFGASETTINYALDYLTIYVMGTLFVQIAFCRQKNLPFSQWPLKEFPWRRKSPFLRCPLQKERKGWLPLKVPDSFCCLRRCRDSNSPAMPALCFLHNAS